MKQEHIAIYNSKCQENLKISVLFSKIRQTSPTRYTRREWMQLDSLRPILKSKNFKKKWCYKTNKNI